MPSRSRSRRKAKPRADKKSRSRSKSRSKVYLPHPKKGALSGYSTKLPQAKREKILDKDVKAHGYATTMRELNLIATLNKTNSPTSSKKIRDDMEKLRQKYR
jgi:hypothetical protein